MPAELQVALDFLNLSQALRAAREAVAGGVDRVEAGTPLIKSEGLDAVRKLREEFAQQLIVADLKIMDAGSVEVEAAAKAGANVVTVMGAASDATISECVEAARRYDVQIMVDLLEVAEPEQRAARAVELGAHLVGVHCPIDAQMLGQTPFDILERVAAAVSVPVAVAGGINSETAPRAVAAGASIVIVGGAIIKAPDAREAAARLKHALATGEAVATDLFKRGTERDLQDVFARSSTANLSDALHRRPALPGIKPLARGMRCAGPAFTVWTYPGDWAKPVEAIDQAQPGDVLVIDVRGEPPAVWGEQATKSAAQRGLAGVVIHGASRDTAEIIALGFPIFCSLYCSNAGDPYGQGMIGVPLEIGGSLIRPGDWVVGDDDGVIVVPKERAVEAANRALAVLEREGREKAEIDAGSTLGEVSELMRWEQRRTSPRSEPPAEDRSDDS